MNARSSRVSSTSDDHYVDVKRRLFLTLTGPYLWLAAWLCLQRMGCTSSCRCTASPTAGVSTSRGQCDSDGRWNTSHGIVPLPFQQPLDIQWPLILLPHFQRLAACYKKIKHLSKHLFNNSSRNLSKNIENSPKNFFLNLSKLVQKGLLKKTVNNLFEQLFKNMLKPCSRKIIQKNL